MSAVRAVLTDGRWHFQHGPIDLIIDCDGVREACTAAMEDCWIAFVQVLPELVRELTELRRPMAALPVATGPVARRMLDACRPFASSRFVTPMAAVAGAVADHLITCFQRPGVSRASINNGGDIALHVEPGERYTVGLLADIEHLIVGHDGVRLDGALRIESNMPVRGIATSGWRGRSFSLGIADSVTVLAPTAACADAAATLIANAVDIDAPGIQRSPACALRDDTDLGTRLVTTCVPPLDPVSIAMALDAGRLEAECWRDRGLVHAVVLFLQQQAVVVAPRARSVVPLPDSCSEIKTCSMFDAC